MNTIYRADLKSCKIIPLEVSDAVPMLLEYADTYDTWAEAKQALCDEAKRLYKEAKERISKAEDHRRAVQEYYRVAARMKDPSKPVEPHTAPDLV